MTYATKDPLATCLVELYGPVQGQQVHTRVVRSLPTAVGERGSSPTTILSAYPDGIREWKGETGLRALEGFLRDHLSGAFSDVHVLPPYVHSGDFGFAVDDHRRIRSDIGSAADLTGIRSNHSLMLDFVMNHVGVGSPIFRAATDGDPHAASFFIHDEGFDTSRVMRGNAPFRDYQFGDSTVRLWSTFSENQVDVDYRNPDVFIEMADQLAAVIASGADSIRLDALVFAWKESGTSCVGLPQATTLASAFRAVAQRVRPGIVFLGEADLTGPGADLVHAGVIDLAYRYEVPVQLAYALVSGRPDHLRKWLEDATNDPLAPAGLLALGTHDGLFLRPYLSPLPPDAIDALVAVGVEQGGHVREVLVNGVRRPYEIDIAFPDLLGGSRTRVLGAIALLLTLPGVPMLTLRNIVGAGSNHALAERTQEGRAVNRGSVEIADVDISLVHSVRELLAQRARYAAFAPDSPLSSIETTDSVLRFVRGVGEVEVLANLGADRIDTTSGSGRMFTLEPFEVRWRDVGSGRTIVSSASLGEAVR